MDKLNLQKVVSNSPIQGKDFSFPKADQPISGEQKNNGALTKAQPVAVFPQAKEVASVDTESLAQRLAETEERLQEAVAKINEELASRQSQLGFSVDDVTDHSVVTVTRKDSGEIIRQIPSETVMQVAHNLEKLKGVLFDDFF
ncbi:MAG: hypothetical protein CBC42_05470 [Betaproteobacteria bacterium TMED82]|nr:MAG: hypothetical protein CBC42_05470 [Betaproteobacteria bacterium TMED82]|tara:strand:- start:160183 stop:160611 length:429 start_codon:yes stop_codon:yes gene_type:complete